MMTARPQLNIVGVYVLFLFIYITLRLPQRINNTITGGHNTRM